MSTLSAGGSGATGGSESQEQEIVRQRAAFGNDVTESVVFVQGHYVLVAIGDAY